MHNPGLMNAGHQVFHFFQELNRHRRPGRLREGSTRKILNRDSGSIQPESSAGHTLDTRKPAYSSKFAPEEYGGKDLPYPPRAGGKILHRPLFTAVAEPIDTRVGHAALAQQRSASRLKILAGENPSG